MFKSNKVFLPRILILMCLALCVEQKIFALEDSPEKNLKRVQSDVFLEGLYQSKLGNAVRPSLASAPVTKSVGQWANSNKSKFFINKMLKSHPTLNNLAAMNQFVSPNLELGADVEYKSLKDALNSYKTLNEFFYRKLSKKGLEARPVDQDKNVVVSMADCHLFVIPDLSKKPQFFVKGCKFDLKKFLNDDMLAGAYNDGALMLFRLAPDDYHRFHFPFDCVPSKPKKISGKFESVNPVAYTPKVQPLIANQRHLIILKSEMFGEVLCMIVGAMMVGSINETYAIESKCSKGDEMGYFAFGGSSIVLIFKKGEIKIDQKFIDKSGELLEYNNVKGKIRKHEKVEYPETKLRLGERIGCASHD